jgi:NAD(P)H-hydrate epimerase
MRRSVLKVVTSAQMRDLEQRAAVLGLPSEVLMDRAGLAVAREMKRLLGGVAGRRVLALVGPGNNGGDGLVAARHLHDWGAEVQICMVKPRQEADVNYRLVRERGIPTVVAGQGDGLPAVDGSVAWAEVVLDALYGTGKSRPLSGPSAEVLLSARARKAKDGNLRVFAVDLPSGLDADTGAVDQSCLPADATITLGYPKVGLYSFPGAAQAGRVVVADIGIPPELAEGILTEVIAAEEVRACLPERRRDASKGTFGRVLVVGGSASYIGAAYLACTAAARVGVGLVTLAIARSLQPILASKLTEVTYLPLPESEPGALAPDSADAIRSALPDCDAVLLGCGLGQSEGAAELAGAVLRSAALPPLILDADALNILARVPQWWRDLPGDAVLTPHPGEMSRLTGLSVEEIQSRRLSTAAEAACAWQKTVVLKGAYTVVAAPDGRVRVNPVANPGLASAGTGDVLAGAIAGLAAQGCRLFDAAVAGVFLHGQAGEVVRGELGDAGMLASDLVPVLPAVISGVKKGGTPRQGWQEDDRCY